MINLLDYLLGISSNVAQTSDYSTLFNTLCNQILTTADTTIFLEPEGLDLYLDGSILDAEPTTTVIATALEYTFRFGMKKKSSPAC